MKQEKAQLTHEEFKARALREAGISYSLSAVLPVLLSLLASLFILGLAKEGYEKQDWYLYLNYLLPQIAFAGVAIIYFLRSGVSLKHTYCGCKWYYFVLALVLQFGLFLSLSGLNSFFIQLLELLGYKQQGMSLPPLGGWNLLPAILVIALLPAVCEETLMRGILSGQMNENGWSTAITVVVSGALFSLFHHNPEQTLYQFACGMCYTLIALRAGSILPTVCAHFCNNAVILTLQSVYAPRFPDKPSFDIIDLLPTGWYIALVVLSALCLVGVLVYLIFFDKRHAQKGKTANGKLFLLAAAVGILVFAITWIMQLAVGFGARVV